MGGYVGGEAPNLLCGALSTVSNESCRGNFENSIIIDLHRASLGVSAGVSGHIGFKVRICQVQTHALILNEKCSALAAA